MNGICSRLAEAYVQRGWWNHKPRATDKVSVTNRTAAGSVYVPPDNEQYNRAQQRHEKPGRMELGTFWRF